MVSAVSSVSQVYAVYFRKTPRTSIATERNLEASSLDEAKAKAKAAVDQHFPGGIVIGVMLAKNAPWPVMDANGEYVAPKRS